MSKILLQMQLQKGQQTENSDHTDGPTMIYQPLYTRDKVLYLDGL